MTSIKVENNTFYRKYNIGASGAIQLSPHFTDASFGQSNTTLDVKGGSSLNVWLISGQTAPAPKTSKGVLKGGNLVLFGNEVDLTETAGVPSVKLFNMKRDYTYNEGSMAAGKTGKDLTVFAAYASPDQYTYEENFDGADSTLGDIKILANEGSTLVNQSGPYVESAQWTELLGKLANGSSIKAAVYGFPGLGDPDSSELSLLKKFFGTNLDGGREGTHHLAIPGYWNPGTSVDDDGFWVPSQPERTEPAECNYLLLTPVNANKPHDLWKPKNDFRGVSDDESGVRVIVPYWKYNDIKGLVKYTNVDTLSDDSTEAAEPTANTTIFSEGLIYTTPDISTFYGSGDDTGLPVTRSTLGLSSEKQHEGGQSLHMYHLWQYSAANSSDDGVDDYFGVKNSFAPQYSCVGMANVPFPIPLDHAFSANNNSVSIPDMGEYRMNLPEIEINFFIDELDTVPRIGSYVDGDQTGKFVDWMGGVATNDYDPIATGTLSGAFWSGTNGDVNNTAKTLGRNFTITFANYPPDEGESLDDYIIRGMDDFYANGGSTAGNYYDYGSKYIGGLTIYRDIGVDATNVENNATNVIAQPLQTRISPVADHANGTATKLDHYTDRMLKFVSGSTASAAGGAANMVCFPALANGETSGSGFEPSVSLSMDKWVTAKFVFDPKGINAQNATDSNTTIAENERCDMCRVYFTDGYISGSSGTVAGDGSGGGAPFAFHPDIPSLPIYFPIRQNSTKSMISWIADKKYWPNVMCIWATNYRNYSPMATGTASETQKWSAYSSNKVRMGLLADIPADTGADKQTSVFVDSIKFNNFTNSVYNASAQAVSNSQSIPIKEYGVKTPVIKPVKPSTNSWESNSIQSTIQDYFTPTYLIMGFDDAASSALETLGTSNVYGGYFLFNGFGTQGYSRMTRQTAATTQGFASNSYWYDSGKKFHTRNLYGYWLDNFTQWTKQDGNQSYSANYASTMIRDGEMDNGTAPQALEVTDFDSHYAEAGATRKGFSFIGDGTTSSSGSLVTDAMTEKGFGTLIFNPTGTAIDPATASAYAGHGYWFKCEHPFVSAKITKIPKYNSAGGDFTATDGRTIEVDNPSIFDLSLDTEYIIYVAGAEGSSANRTSTTEYWDFSVYPLGTDYYDSEAAQIQETLDTTITTIPVQEGFVENNVSWFSQCPNLWMEFTDAAGNTEVMRILSGYAKPIEATHGVTDDTLLVERGAIGTTARSFSAWSSGVNNAGLFLKQVISAKGLKQVEKRDGNTITLDSEASAVVTPENLPYLYISPYKYWLWLQLWPGGNTNPVVDAGGSSAKSYMSILPCASGSDAVTTTGSTYNEEMYTFAKANYASIGKMAAYANTWDVSLGSDSAVQVNDYGHGGYNEAENTGGYLDLKTAYDSKVCALSLSGMASETPAPSQEIITKLALESPLAEQTIKFYGNDYVDAGSIFADDVKPYYLWSYSSPVGSVDNLEVKPNIDLLKPDFDLYSIGDENLAAVNFTWDESLESVWYRMLLVDVSGATIPNKYHRAVLHLPLNEAPTLPTTKPTNKVYNYTAPDSGILTGTAVTGDRCRADIQGANGYTLRPKNNVGTGYLQVTGGATDSTTPNQNPGLAGLTEFTFVIHFTADSGPAGGLTNVFSQGDGTSSALLHLDESTGRVVFTFTNSSATAYSLSSKTSVAYDGETPMCVVVTYKASSDAGPDMQMFVDGVREDYLQTVAGSIGGTPNIRIGCDGAGSPTAGNIFKGTIEEVIVYDKAYYIPENAGSYVLNTADIADAASNKKLTHNARLFVYDYHNIRGDPKNKVAYSDEANWGATSL